MEVKEPNVKYLTAQFKRTEAGDIPIDWLDKTVGDMAEVTSGGTPSRKVTAYWDGDIPWVTTAELECGQVTSAAQHITLAGLQNSAAKWLPAGTLLIALYGQGKTRGKCAVLRIAATTNQACAGIKLEEGVDGDFVRHNLTHRYEYIRSLSNGGSQENLSGEIVKKIHIGMPSTPTEQRAIAAALTDADSLIDSLEQLLTKKRQIKQGTMQELLTGKRRLPGFAGDWTCAPLGEIARIKTGSMNNQDKVEDGEFPFFVRSQSVERIDTYTHDCEAILIPGEGGIGSIFHYFHGRFALHQRVYGITDFSESVLGRFVYFFMRVFFGPHAMENSVKATVDSLRLPTFMTFEVRLPPTVAEQTAIVEVLSDLEVNIAALEERLTKARALKQAMAQALLTGRIRLVEPTT
ncbi:restriction endonuclease subunit S [Aquabacterium sp.]|uniref:restriction endonuclease subunit S n=1 Tax=Aquabacterium sp. TaxID=1872578 RepID=UPI0035B17549